MVTPKKGADAPEFGIQHNCKGKLHRRKQPANAFGKRKRRAFLEHLAHSSNVTASSKAAGISASTVYRTRDNDPGFAADWRAALASGYELLEMELLHRARFGSDTTEIDADYKMRKIVHSFSDTLGVRLLAMHRETVNAHRLEAAGDGWVTRADIEITSARIADIGRALAERRARDRARQHSKGAAP